MPAIIQHVSAQILRLKLTEFRVTHDAMIEIAANQALSYEEIFRLS